MPLRLLIFCRTLLLTTVRQIGCLTTVGLLTILSKVHPCSKSHNHRMHDLAIVYEN